MDASEDGSPTVVSQQTWGAPPKRGIAIGAWDREQSDAMSDHAILCLIEVRTGVSAVGLELEAPSAVRCLYLHFSLGP